MTVTIGDAFASLMRGGMPVRFTAYDGSETGPASAAIGLHLRNERGLAYLLTAPGDLGMARAYVVGDLDLSGVHPGDPYDACHRRARHSRSCATSDSAGCARRPRRPRNTCRGGGVPSRGCGTRWPATPR